MRAWQVILILACLVASFTAGYHIRGNDEGTKVRTDTVIVVDTVRDSIPVPVKEIEIEEIEIPYPVLVTVKGDTIRDTTYIPISISQQEYLTESYHAWISGYNAALDSIEVFPKTVYITKKVPVRRWGLGVIGGYGIGRSGLSPYIGVGVYYKIW